MHDGGKGHNTDGKPMGGGFKPLHWLFAISVAAAYVWGFNHFFVSPTGFRWRALYGDPKHPGGYGIRGIDISHHQGVIDWDRLANGMIDGTPPRFIIIKATEGATLTDRRFHDNFRNAREYGYIRGAYHFWSNKSPARDQARHFLEQVRLLDGDLPPVLDIERKPVGTKEEFQREILAWLHTVEDRYHVKPIIYTYRKFREEYLDAPVFGDYPYWVAHYYVDEMDYEGEWSFWQHTDAGKLPGINGYVDLDVYNGSYYELKRLTIGGSVSGEEDAPWPY